MTHTGAAVQFSGVLVGALLCLVCLNCNETKTAETPLCEEGVSRFGPNAIDLRFCDRLTNPPLRNMDLEHFDVRRVSFRPEGGVSVAVMTWGIEKDPNTMEGGAAHISIQVPPECAKAKRLRLEVTLCYREKDYEFAADLVEEEQEHNPSVRWRMVNESMRQHL